MRTYQRRRFDSVYLCVADERRRQVLEHLRDADDGTASFDELVDVVLEREPDSATSTRQSVIIDLYHVHLPKLADYGVVDYEDDPDTISYESDPKVESLLEGMSYPQAEATPEHG